MINLAGLPAISEYGGKDFLTTLFAPTTQCLPKLTPLKINECAPIKQSSSIMVGFGFVSPLSIGETSAFRYSWS